MATKTIEIKALNISHLCKAHRVESTPNNAKAEQNWNVAQKF
jgi:hypothetical protein